MPPPNTNVKSTSLQNSSINRPRPATTTAWATKTQTPHPQVRPTTAAPNFPNKSKTILNKSGRAYAKSPTKSKSPARKGSMKRVTLSEHVEIQGPQRQFKVNPVNQLPSETKSATGSSGRQEYVEYALDMLTHNLIGSGQLPASQAHMVKTPELRSHIYSLLDRVEASHQVGRSMQIASKTSTHIGGAAGGKVIGKQWAVQPNSLPITIITNKDPTAKAEKRGSTGAAANSSRPGSASKEKKRTNVLSIPITTLPKPILPTKQEKAKLPISNLNEYHPRPGSAGHHQQAQKQKLTTAADTGTKKSNPTPTIGRQHAPNRPNHSVSLHSPLPNKAGGSQPPGTVLEERLMDQLSFRFDPLISITSDGGFRAKFDMRGFENDEILLNLQDHKLTVSGVRPKRDGMNERKTTETVDIPPVVNLDKLKVARRLDGFLQIEETPVVRSG